MPKATVRDIEVSGKRVLVRVDFNVPMDGKTGQITDDSRIRATLPTISYLTRKGARLILCSHLGRPKGKVVESLSLAPVGRYLAGVLGQPVALTGDCIGPEAERAAASLKNGQILLLENLRFHPEEEKNEASFARALARLAEVYVNDAFGASHRAHASIVGVAAYLPAVAGLLLEKELDRLGHILETPAHPFAVLLGGAKISDKVGMLDNIMPRVDHILVGGGMAAIFLQARGYQVGLSLVEDSQETATRLMAKAASSGVKLWLPEDVLVAAEVSAEAKPRPVSIDHIPADQRIVDIGERTVSRFSQELKQCRTIFWNGPIGIYEIPRFAGGTQAMARLLASLKATTIIGGGSTAEVVAQLGLADKMGFVSTGGGASLRFLSGESLPGVEALRDKEAIANG
ncbi:MAG: phosphoglycerate kinase [Chloroflexota bacterium]